MEKRWSRSLGLSGLLLAIIALLAFGGDTVSVKIAVDTRSVEALPLLPVCVEIRVTNTAIMSRKLRPLIPEVGWPRSAGISSVVSAIPATPDPFPPSMYQFVIKPESGTEFRSMFSDFTGATHVGGDRAMHPGRISLRELRPGAAWVQDYCLGFGMTYDGSRTSNQILFPDPGKYLVKLEMPFLVGGGIGSNEIGIVVRHPETENDKKAYELLYNSPFRTIFLNPPQLRYGSPLPSPNRPSVNPDAARLADEIASTCPNSRYAPYAKLIVAMATSEGWISDPDHPGGLEQANTRLAGFRLLRQCAEDPKLPRRYCEAAMRKLRTGEFLDRRLKKAAAQRIPDLESIVPGAGSDLGGLTPQEVLGIAYQLAVGSEGPVFGRAWLEKRFTVDQIEALKTAASGNSAVAEAAGLTPLQKELQGNVNWAREELKKLPWRDPNTGEQKSTALSSSGL